MLTAGLALEDAAAPRTVYYQKLLEAIRRSGRFRASGARIVLPSEDTAQETNWPRYGDMASAYLRGGSHDLDPDGAFDRYLARIGEHAAAHPAQSVLVVNMHPFVRLPQRLADVPNLLVADGCLSGPERERNPRTIAMPALPMVGAPGGTARRRDLLASFRGAASHPVRQALARLDGQPGISVQLVDPSAHKGRIDAERGRTDAAYEELIDRSVFSFVPRGDALFSYRLLEVMARGSIPVVLSDGWVLPFDRLIDWERVAIRFDESRAAEIPAVLRAMDEAEVESFRAGVRLTYEERFSSLDSIVEAMLSEAEAILEEEGGAS